MIHVPVLTTLLKFRGFSFAIRCVMISNERTDVKMSLTMSAVGFALCLALIMICVIIDKKSGEDRCRLIISITGIVAMMCLFFLLVNLMIAAGVLK